MMIQSAVGVFVRETSLKHILQQVLEKSGFRLFVASTDQDILTFCTQQDVEMVILEMRDLRLVRAIRAMYGHHQTPIMVCVDHDDEQINTAFEYGATDCIILPINATLLKRRIDQHLYNAHAVSQSTTLSGQYETIYDNAPVMIHSVNRKGELRYVNKMWLSKLGYTRETVIGKPFLNFVERTTHRELQYSIDNFWQVGAVRDRVSRLIRADGNVMDVIFDSNRFNDPLEGEVSITILRDVTLQRQMEATIRHADREKQSIINAMHDVVYVIDGQGKIVEIPSVESPQAPRYVRRLVGRTLHDIMPENRADFLLSQVKMVLETGTTANIEYDLMIFGEQSWFNTAISPLNELCVVAVARDITESKQKGVLVQESERLYRNLFESATDGIMLVDIDHGRILEANNSVANLLGYSLDELTGMNIKQIELPRTYTTDTLTLDIESNQQMLFEQMYRRKDGTLVPVESHSRIIRYRNRAAVLNFSRDVTHRRRALQKEHELRLLAEALRDSAAAFNQCVSSDEVLDAIIAHVQRVVNGIVANVMLVGKDGTARLVRWRGYDSLGFNDDTMLGTQFELEKTVNLRVMRDTHRPICINDVASFAEWQESRTTEWIRAYLGAPIFARDELIGFVNLDSSETDFFKPEQMENLQAFANQAAIAFENVRLIEHIQRQNLILEERVAERTQELSHINLSLEQIVRELSETQDALQQERTLLRMVMDNIPDMIYLKDRDGHYMLMNSACMEALGIKDLSEAKGRTMRDFFDKTYTLRHKVIDAHILASGEPVINMDNLMRYANGTEHRQLLTKKPLFDSTGHVTGILGINRDVTEMRRIEESLNEEREQLRQVLMAARCLLWQATVTKTEETMIWEQTVINEETAQTFLPLDVSKNTYTQIWQSQIFNEDLRRREYILQTHLQFSRPSFSHELRIRRADGGVLWLTEDVQIKPLGENKWRLVGICTDITERKRAEDNLQRAYGELELRIAERTTELVQANTVLKQEIGERKRAEEAERKQRILAEALSQSVATLNRTFDRDALLDYLLDTIGDIVPHDAANIMLLEDDHIHATIVRLRGYHRYEGEGTTLRHDITLYPDKQHILQNNDHFIIHDTRTFEGWQGTSGFEWIRSQLSVPIRLDEGVIGFLNLDSVVPNHFTLQHAEWLMAFANQAALAIRNARMLDQIREYNAELEKNVASRTAQLRAILDAMRDGLIYHSSDRKTQYFNQALIEILGYDSDFWWQYDASDATPLVASPLEIERLTARSGKLLSLNGYYEDEITLRRKNGTTFPAQLTRVLVKSSEGENVGLLTLVRDISQAKQLEAQKARFIANASHELRTPIANMKTRLFLMRRKPERFEEHIEIAESVARYMQHLIDDMFDLARFERGTIELKREKIILQDILTQLIEFQRPEAERKDIFFMTNLPNTPLEVEFDPYRFMQVITNLLTNAINYTPEGGQVRVDVLMEEKALLNTLVIKVSDTGQGISPENLTQLFTPFFRANDSSKGAGLGLAISQEIIHLHGGEIAVESEYGKGSTFVVTIPI